AEGAPAGRAPGRRRRRETERVALRDEQLEPRLGERKGIQRRFVVGVHAPLARQRGEPRREQDRQHDDHEQRHWQRDTASATGGVGHLSWLLKNTAVTTCACRGAVAPSGARSLWLVRPSSRPRTLVSRLGTAAWAVSLPTTKKRNFALVSNGATSCPSARSPRSCATAPSDRG